MFFLSSDRGSGSAPILAGPQLGFKLFVFQGEVVRIKILGQCRLHKAHSHADSGERYQIECIGYRPGVPADPRQSDDRPLQHPCLEWADHWPRRARAIHNQGRVAPWL